MPTIPDATLRTLARTLVAQGRGYGFGFEDYVRLASLLLDEAMEHRPPPASAEATLPLRGAEVHVRAPTDADHAVIRGWCTHPDGRYFLLSRSTGAAMDVEALLDDPATALGLVTLPDGTPIGVVGYLAFDRQQRRAELRKLIAEPRYRGRGLGTEAARLWVGYGLHALGLRKVFLYTLASNRRNVQLNQRLGFRVEGVLRDEVVIDGAPHDLLRMGLVAG